MASQVKVRPARAPAKRSAESAHLSPDQLVEVLELLKGATSVELKLTVPDSQRPVIRRLGFDPAAINAELRHDDAFKIEVDAMLGGYVCSGSARGRCPGQDAQR